MNIAVVYDQGDVGLHFGHAKQMKFYRTAPTGLILESHVEDTNVSGHVAMCDFLREHDVQALICHNIGQAACSILLQECYIELYAGISGNADLAVQRLLEGRLKDFQIKYYFQIYGKEPPEKKDKNTSPVQTLSQEECECGDDCNCEGDCSDCSHL